MDWYFSYHGAATCKWSCTIQIVNLGFCSCNKVFELYVSILLQHMVKFVELNFRCCCCFEV
jgi:hypothetical protein